MIEVIVIVLCMVLVFMIISRLGALSKGVWFCYQPDYSGIAIFPADEELKARKYANDHSCLVEFKKFGAIR